MKKVLWISLLLFGMLSQSCKVQKGAGYGEDACTTSGKVQDFSGLDGCKLLIVLDNGDKYLPMKPEFNGLSLADGQNIRFGYKEVEGVASICMTESKTIELTCLELEEDIPIKPECFNTDSPTTGEMDERSFEQAQPGVYHQVYLPYRWLGLLFPRENKLSLRLSGQLDL